MGVSFSPAQQQQNEPATTTSTNNNSAHNSTHSPGPKKKKFMGFLKRPELRASKRKKKKDQQQKERENEELTNSMRAAMAPASSFSLPRNLHTQQLSYDDADVGGEAEFEGIYSVITNSNMSPEKRGVAGQGVEAEDEEVEVRFMISYIIILTAKISKSVQTKQCQISSNFGLT